MRVPTICGWPVLLATLLCGVATTAWSDDFRVETDVFLGKEREPVAESLTLFVGDVVYDFVLTGEQEISIFDTQRGTVVLLAPDRQVKSILTQKEILEFTASLQVRGLERRQEAFVQPQFDLDVQDQLLTLASRSLTYQAEGVEPDDPTAVARFHSFADWYARLNAMARGGLPPFGRMELNRQLAERKLIPKTVERTIVWGGVRGKQVARSQSLFNWAISNTDRRRIQQAGSMQANFRQIGFPAYHQVERSK